MKIFNFELTTDRMFRLLFHLVFWIVWIGFPIINAGNNEHFWKFYLAILPVVFTNIPLFLLNSEWLIPRIFRRKGLGIYLLLLLALILTFSSLQMILKEWLIPENLVRKHWDVFWSVVPVIFLTAISTGYGFIVFLLNEEKGRQEEQQERLRSELSFLRSQISPHFIFNILNSIVYLIRSRSELAEPVTIKLSELLRYMLYTSREAHAPLDQELEYLENYVELQKIRFGEDVDIRMVVEGQANMQFIEPMLLIPFVENAFKHGVGLVSDPVIDINLKVSDEGLDFRVKNKISPDGDKDPDSGIGLRNVVRRLELLYQDSHSLRINSDNGWFEVNLYLGFGRKNP
ncbi:MAG: histidine kinase [Bacteroidia bacterium]|nr:histidine kinase [Bacteroidia bacterium]